MDHVCWFCARSVDEGIEIIGFMRVSENGLVDSNTTSPKSN